MAHTQQSRAPSLELIFETIHGFQRTAALKAALEFDIFSGIADGTDTAAGLAEGSGASERGMRILCDSLTVFGLLTKSAGHYHLTPDSAFFLNRNSPAYMGMAVDFLLSPPQVEPFEDLAAAVRSGHAVTGDGVVAPDHPVWVKFARAMAPLMAMPAELAASLLTDGSEGKIKVLDIAAGHGLYGIAVGKRNANAEIFAVDWPNVLAVAEEHARAAGIDDRFRKVVGSAFDVNLGNGYDLVLLPNFLHHFDPVTVGQFLRRIHAVLKPGGRAAIIEFIPDEDRISPRVPAQFSLMMLPTTPGGDAYTFREYQNLLGEAGYVSSELHELAPTYFRAVLARR